MFMHLAGHFKMANQFKFGHFKLVKMTKKNW